MEKNDYDVVIIGGGPAGLTAGLYASRARLRTLLVEKAAPGGQALITDWIENYPGFPEGVSGMDLVEKMTDQARKFGLEIESDEAMSMDLDSDRKTLSLSGKTLTASSVIIATGAAPRNLGVPGEERFFGRGLSFCATCDGPFYKDRVLAAVGGGDTAVQETVFLTRFAKKVYLVHRRDQLRATRILQERALANDRIEFVWDSVVKGVGGLSNIENVTVENVKTGEERQLSVDGLFVWIGILPNTGFLGDSLRLDPSGFVMTDEKMETSAPGVFAAGDVRSKPLRQISTAVGDAATAAFSAEHYIESL
ncbi:Thioredoxin reductase [Candidatus Desulfarcum epimagneticum]|uniref:Thioredoxin reductase n=1 Tax=uncultured Desulfobacteraceae bacterium TaxID=218296 RepID=A0A484HP78_9BACT|nr:Thioredoxin reductase [uncultured Desulfobacteraceae bacterium]